MPLDTQDHIRAAWSMVNRPVVRKAMEDELLGSCEVVNEVLEEARDRIQLAAVESGMGLFPQAGPRA